jgi:hypothetical protein
MHALHVLHPRRAIRAVLEGRLRLLAICQSWMPSALAVVGAVLIAVLVFRYGDQPVAFDAAGYVDLGQVIVNDGLGAFASELRTYGYPAMLAAIMLVVGQDLDNVQAAVLVVQLGLLIGAAWVGARRLGGMLDRPGLAPVIFAVTVLNPIVLCLTVQVLTDLPAAVLIYLSVVLSLPQRRPEGASRVILLAGCALFGAGFAVILRPASLAVAPVVGGIWLARALLVRDVPWLALPVALLAFAVPFAPQVWSNQRAFGVASPLIVTSLYANQLDWGLQYAKYATLVVPGVPNTLFYDNPFRPPPGWTVGQTLSARPLAYLATLAVHAFALVDQDFPLIYIRDVNPWYRWPVSVLSYLFLLGAAAGAVLGLRGTARGISEAPSRQRFAVVALGVAALAVVAIYLPTAVESRFSLPLYLLLAAPCALALSWVAARVPTAGPLAVSIGTLAVAVWVGLGAAGSIWLQGQAPLLVAVREGSAGGQTASRSGSAPPEAAVSPGPSVVPAREIPLASYEADLPRELVVRKTVELDVTVTNQGQESWSPRGSYPVNVAARFIARTTELHERVKGLMRDSQPAALPYEVQPGASATVHFRLVAPPEPGRYTLMVHVTRIGVPDSTTRIERTVRVVESR